MELEIVKFFNQLGMWWVDPATIFISSNVLLGIFIATWTINVQWTLIVQVAPIGLIL